MSNDHRMLLMALKAARQKRVPEELPEDYKKALETLGLVDFAWDTRITALGESILAQLEPDDWGS